HDGEVVLNVRVEDRTHAGFGFCLLGLNCTCAPTGAPACSTIRTGSCSREAALFGAPTTRNPSVLPGQPPSGMRDTSMTITTGGAASTKIGPNVDWNCCSGLRTGTCAG